MNTALRRRQAALSESEPQRRFQAGVGRAGLPAHSQVPGGWHRHVCLARDRAGERFLEILRTRVNQAGFYLMDEPDAPLSFVSCLSLLAVLCEIAEAGAQVVVATHSPIIAAVPGARILELGEWGIRTASWSELELVAEWREFLREPQSFLWHLLGDEAASPS